MTASLRRDLADRRHDVRIRAAAAEIAAHELSDLLIRAGPPLVQQRDRRHDLPGRAVAALKAVMADERLLQWMQLPVPRESFDRRHLSALALRGEGEAGQHALAVDQDRARTARPLIAALLRPDQPEVLAQRVKQRHPAIQPQTPRAPVDAQHHGDIGRTPRFLASGHRNLLAAFFGRATTCGQRGPPGALSQRDLPSQLGALVPKSVQLFCELNAAIASGPLEGEQLVAVTELTTMPIGAP